MIDLSVRDRGVIMEKTYYDFMREISAEEIYDRLVQHGMFSEKLPPILSAELFLDYCKNKRTQSFEDKWYGYIAYENMRNINIPRNLGIPTPMGHELLCKCISDNWDKIIEHFKEKTFGQTRIVSRIHIRKMQNTEALFEMNYKNWRSDGTPEPDIYIGKKYMVHADISKCYPSIYTHAIPWALAGKAEAKNNVHNESKWYNTIDHFAQYSKNGETHGLLIGPHTSNILSEIILCAIDANLTKKYKNYFRNIDDYICYVDSKEAADQFLVDLNRELREFDLLMNHKKTEILEMPLCVVETWIHKIQNQTALFQKGKEYVDYKEIQAYIDFTIRLVNENDENHSILFYAVKVIKDFNLTRNAKEYLVKSIVSLALLYPYLVPILDEFVFKPYQIANDKIGEYANMIFDKYISKNNFEACSYAIMYAVNSGAKINNFNLDIIIDNKDCVLLLLALIYCKKVKWRSGVEKLKKTAKALIDANEMDQYWLFIYECLGSGSLTGDWSAMKKAKVSFFKSEFR